MDDFRGVGIRKAFAVLSANAKRELGHITPVVKLARSLVDALDCLKAFADDDERPVIERLLDVIGEDCAKDAIRAYPEEFDPEALAGVEAEDAANDFDMERREREVA